MRKLRVLLAGAAMCLLPAAMPASAAPMSSVGQAIKADQVRGGQVEQVRNRWHRHRHYRRGWAPYYGYYNPYGYRRYGYYSSPYYGYGYYPRYHRRPGFSFGFRF